MQCPLLLTNRAHNILQMLPLHKQSPLLTCINLLPNEVRAHQSFSPLCLPSDLDHCLTTSLVSPCPLVRYPIDVSNPLMQRRDQAA